MAQPTCDQCEDLDTCPLGVFCPVASEAFDIEVRNFQQENLNLLGWEQDVAEAEKVFNAAKQALEGAKSQQRLAVDRVREARDKMLRAAHPSVITDLGEYCEDH